MTRSRREFLGTVSAAAALSGLGCGPTSPGGDNGTAAGSLVQGSDPLGLRNDFPVVEELVYLDGAYITPSPRQAVEAAQTFAASKARNPVSLGAMLTETNAMREKFAQLVGASVSEIGVLYATSDGENIVATALDLQAGDNVVIDDLHYDTTYLLYQELAERVGLEVRRVTSEDGIPPIESFEELVDDRTKLISVSWVSHQNGYAYDLKVLADLAHSHGAYLYADAIQGIGMLELDVAETGIDFFTAGTYKWLLGGFGVAPFYVREGLLELIDYDRYGSLQIADDLGDFRYTIHTDARKYGYATMGFGAVFQLSASLSYLLDVGVSNIERHTVALAHRLRDGWLRQGYDVWTPAGNRSSIVTFDHGKDIARVRSDLEGAGVKVSLKQGGAQIRAGIALFNNNEDFDALLFVPGGWVSLGAPPLKAS